MNDYRYRIMVKKKLVYVYKILHVLQTLIFLCIIIGTLFVTSDTMAKVLDFEGEPNLKIIDNWYSDSHNVVFDRSHIITPTLGSGPGGKKALQVGATPQIEFHSGPLTMVFTSDKAMVRMLIGLVEETLSPVSVELKAFDLSGNLIGSPVKTSIGPGPTPITKSIQINSSQSNIRSVTLQYESEYHEVIDNLELDSYVPLPDDKDPPIVTIEKPATGTELDTQFFLIEGKVIEDNNLMDVILNIDPPSKEQVSYQIYYYQKNESNYSFGGSTSYGLLSEGKNTITVRAVDVKGNSGEDTIELIYTPKPTVKESDLYPSAMEITQSIHFLQRLPNPPYGAYSKAYLWYGVPLVRDKQTYVRVYANAEGGVGSVVNVGCELTGRRTQDNSLLPGSPLKADTPMITVDPNQSMEDKRVSPNLTWNFNLPLSWTNEDKISLIANVNPPNAYVSECCYDALNTKTVYNIHFEDFPNLIIHPFRTRVRRAAADPGGSGDILSQAEVLQSLSGNQSALPLVWPVADGDIDIHYLPNSVINFDGDFSPGPHYGWMSSNRMSSLLGKIYSRLIWDFYGYPYNWITYALYSPPVNHVYVGFVPKPTGGTSGIAKTGKPVCVVKVDPNNYWNDSIDIIAHELGHTLGLRHTPSIRDSNGNAVSPCDDAEGEDYWYPHYKGAGGVDLPWPSIGEWGTNTRNFILYNPSSYYDFMSYCGSEWISPYTNTKLTVRLREGPVNPVSHQHNGLQSIIEESLGEYLIVFGEITSNNKLILRPSYQVALPYMLQKNIENASYAIVLHDERDNEFFRKNFQIDKIMDSDESSNFFAELIPFQRDRAKRLIIESRGEIVAQKLISQNSPVVNVIYPNGGEVWDSNGKYRIQWNGEDRDGDDITYVVQYSIDNGLKWQTLETNINTTEIFIDTNNIPGGHNALIKVIGTDGINTAIDTSDNSFRVPSKHPFIEIIEPENEAKFRIGQRVRFIGMGTDLEDGPLQDNNLAWYSDRQGFLGYGKRMDYKDLSLGEHVIELRGMDSEGKNAIKSRRITILPNDMNIQFRKIEATNICSKGASHSIYLAWFITSKLGVKSVGPLIVNIEGQLPMRLESKFAQSSDLMFPVNLPMGGKITLNLQAQNKNGEWFSNSESIKLDLCIYQMELFPKHIYPNIGAEQSEH